MNLLVIVVDTWRYDLTNSTKATPFIYQFSKQASVFPNILVGEMPPYCGNSALFYGVPSTYSFYPWKSKTKELDANQPTA